MSAENSQCHGLYSRRCRQDRPDDIAPGVCLPTGSRWRRRIPVRAHDRVNGVQDADRYVVEPEVQARVLAELLPSRCGRELVHYDGRQEGNTGRCLLESPKGYGVRQELK